MANSRDDSAPSPAAKSESDTATDLGPQSTRTRNAQRTKSEILRVATEEFAELGLNGARVDVIARRTSTTKRMLYYYFESKEGLYTAALEAAYARTRANEQDLKLDDHEPLDGILALADHTFEHHTSNDAFLRLVAIENIHRARFLKANPTIADQNNVVIETLQTLLRRGQDAGTLRPEIDAVDVHLAISAFCVFIVNNRHTFGTLFDRNLLDPDRREHYRAMLRLQITGLVSAAPLPCP